MEFKPFHLLFFGAKIGAFSKVTDREYYDSQITLTDLEAEVVINFFGRNNIHIGNVGSDPEKAAKPFLLYNEDRKISLNLVFPKPDKQELRLYLSSGNGFKPNGGLIWFIFINQHNEIVIGSLDDLTWNSLGQSDIDDDDYNAEIDQILSPKLDFNVNTTGEIIQKSIGERLVYMRNPKLAAYRFNLANYKCEINPQHITFTSAKTGMSFVEAHHLIPMKFQSIFLNHPLDNIDNIISLCPNCHRGFHHAVMDEKLDLITNIYNKRPAIKTTYSLTDIAEYYNCIKL